MDHNSFTDSQRKPLSFYRLPRALIKNAEFRLLSANAKLLYALLLDRMSLSVRNGWLDDHGRVYIYYTIAEICGDLGCSRVTAGKLLAELDADGGFGLIERKHQGIGKPDRIYVKIILVSTAQTSQN